MNSKLKTVFKKKGMSVYRLSKDSGVNYSVVYNLIKHKKDINQCSAETAARLASALGVNILDILNPIHFLDGVSGKYRNVRFQWEYNNGMVLHLHGRNSTANIRPRYRFDRPDNMEIYKGYTQFYIDKFISDLEFCENVRKTM